MVRKRKSLAEGRRGAAQAKAWALNQLATWAEEGRPLGPLGRYAQSLAEQLETNKRKIQETSPERPLKFAKTQSLPRAWSQPSGCENPVRWQEAPVPAKRRLHSVSDSGPVGVEDRRCFRVEILPFPPACKEPLAETNAGLKKVKAEALAEPNEHKMEDPLPQRSLKRVKTLIKIEHGPVGLEPKVKTEPVPEEMKTEPKVKREPKVKTEVDSVAEVAHVPQHHSMAPKKSILRTPEKTYAQRRVHYDDDAKKTTFIPSKKGQKWRWHEVKRVNCEVCQMLTLRADGQMQGAPGRSQLAQCEFVCFKCLGLSS